MERSSWWTASVLMLASFGNLASGCIEVPGECMGGDCEPGGVGGGSAPPDPSEESAPPLSEFLPLAVGNVWLYEYSSTYSWSSGIIGGDSGSGGDEGIAALELLAREGDGFRARWVFPGGTTELTLAADTRTIRQDGVTLVNLDAVGEVHTVVLDTRVSTMTVAGDSLHLSSAQQEGCFGCAVAGVTIYSSDSDEVDQYFTRGLGITSFRSATSSQRSDESSSRTLSWNLVAHRIDVDGEIEEEGDVETLLTRAGESRGEETAPTGGSAAPAPAPTDPASMQGAAGGAAPPVPAAGGTGGGAPPQSAGTGGFGVGVGSAAGTGGGGAAGSAATNACVAGGGIPSSTGGCHKPCTYDAESPDGDLDGDCAPLGMVCDGSGTCVPA